MKKVLLSMTLLLAAAASAQTTPATPTTPTPAPAAPTTTPARAAASAPAAASPVVAQVGNEKFTLDEFNRDFRIAVARAVNAQGMPFDDSMLAMFADARAEYLKTFARQRALYQLARASVKPDSAAVDAQLTKARQNFASDQEFTAALTQTGYISLADFRTSLERQTVTDAYLASIQKRFSFGDALVAGYYNLHKATFTSEASACVKHILVATRPEADAIVKDLNAGGDFARIATAKSQDFGSAKDGGDLGCIAPGDTVATFDKASFSGPIGQPQVVQSEYGWHVLVVTKRTAAGLRPLAEVAPLIRDQLSREAAQKYLDTQIARVNVQTFPDAVKVTVPAPATK